MAELVIRRRRTERSLATISYFMSLMERPRPPFSLVDEISPGMGAQAERQLVHN